MRVGDRVELYSLKIKFKYAKNMIDKNYRLDLLISLAHFLS